MWIVHFVHMWFWSRPIGKHGCFGTPFLKKLNHILFLCLKHAISFTVRQNKSASDIEYRYLKILPLFDLDAVCRKMWSSMHTSLDIEYVVYMLCVHIGEFIIERRATIG